MATDDEQQKKAAFGDAETGSLMEPNMPSPTRPRQPPKPPWRERTKPFLPIVLAFLVGILLAYLGNVLGGKFASWIVIGACAGGIGVVGWLWPPPHLIRPRVSLVLGALLFVSCLVMAFAVVGIPKDHQPSAAPVPPPLPPPVILSSADALVPLPVPFSPYGLIKGHSVDTMHVRDGYQGDWFCYTVSFRDRSDSGGHWCADRQTKRELDPCYVNSALRGSNGRASYACYRSPWDDPHTFDTFDPPPTKMLPPPADLAQRLANTKGADWGLRLTNRKYCLFSFGEAYEKDPFRVGGILPKRVGRTYLCAKSPARLNIVQADGWIVGKIRKRIDGWWVYYQPDVGSPEWARVTKRLTGPT